MSWRTTLKTILITTYQHKIAGLLRPQASAVLCNRRCCADDDDSLSAHVSFPLIVATSLS
jgi:hypothetical protein